MFNIFKFKKNIFKEYQPLINEINFLENKLQFLTNEDLKFENGKETELFKRLETKLGKNRNEIVSILKTNQEAINEVI